nr:MAG TPA: hypothetical protein [Caudoviricetes sp.]
MCSTGYVLSQYGRLSSFFWYIKKSRIGLIYTAFTVPQTLVSLYRTENCSRLNRVF